MLGTNIIGKFQLCICQWMDFILLTNGLFVYQKHVTYLQYGRFFVEVFLRLGMPLLDHMFKGHQQDIHGLLKNLQQSTRALHHMCGHSKVDFCFTMIILLIFSWWWNHFGQSMWTLWQGECKTPSSTWLISLLLLNKNTQTTSMPFWMKA